MKLWIARDENGLFSYAKKPMFFEGFNEFGCMIGEEFCELPSNWFPEVTFENSPQEIELRLEKENIVKILKAYDNIFGLSDGGIARSDEDIEHAADVILESLKESNS